MQQVLELPGGTIGYDLAGTGPLVVLVHGIGDSRQAYRFVVPALIAAGYRVANVDLRGCGSSTAGWASYTRTDVASDLVALVRHLGGPAVLVGHSFSGGAVTIAAATAPELIAGIVEIGPFTRKQAFHPGDLRVPRYRAGVTRLLMAALFGSVSWWHRYLDVAFPGRKPSDWDEVLRRNGAMLRQPGRMAAMRKMGMAQPVDAQAALASVACPALVLMGSLDPDWVSPRDEAEAIVAALPAGIGSFVLIEGAGHYPQSQFPDETVAALLRFLAKHARA